MTSGTLPPVSPRRRIWPFVVAGVGVLVLIILAAEVISLHNEITQLRQQMITCSALSHLSIVSSDSNGDSFALGEWSSYGYGASRNRWTLPPQCRHR